MSRYCPLPIDTTDRGATATGPTLAIALAGVLLAVLPADALGDPDDEEDGEQFAQAARAEPPRALPAELDLPSFRWQNEQFYYSLRIGGAEALRATLKAGELRYNDQQPYVPLALRVRSVGFFDDIYSVDDRADTYMDPQSHRPYKTVKIFREGGSARSYIVTYDREDYRADVSKVRNESRNDYTRPVPGSTHDMITWMYHLRTRDIGLGDTFRYYVYDGWKLSWVHMKVVAKEDLYTPAGWFKAWKFDFVRKVMDSKAREDDDGNPAPPKMTVDVATEHEGNFWLSRDANHLPLRVTIGTGWGSGEAIIVRYDRHST